MAASNNPNRYQGQPLADYDPGFYKITELNPKSERKIQKFTCKYCSFTSRKLHNMRDHVYMHKG